MQNSEKETAGQEQDGLDSHASGLAELAPLQYFMSRAIHSMFTEKFQAPLEIMNMPCILEAKVELSGLINISKSLLGTEQGQVSLYTSRRERNRKVQLEAAEGEFGSCLNTGSLNSGSIHLIVSHLFHSNLICCSLPHCSVSCQNFCQRITAGQL